MKTLRDVLQEADPVAHEDVNGRRLQRRAAVLAAPRTGGPAAQPRRAVWTLLVLAMIGIGAGSLYWAGAIAKAASVRFAVHLAEETAGPDLLDAGVVGGRRIYLHPDPVVTNGDIAEAHIAPGSTPATYAISVELTASGAVKMHDATARHVGHPVAILVDGEAVMAPVIRDPISTAALITGDYPRAEAERIVAGIIGR